MFMNEIFNPQYSATSAFIDYNLARSIFNGIAPLLSTVLLHKYSSLDLMFLFSVGLIALAAIMLSMRFFKNNVGMVAAQNSI